MRLVAITRVLNEADIIESFVRHTARFTVHHILMDNGSSDGTVEILSSLADEGLPLSLYQSRAVTFNESDSLTQLYQFAVSHRPNWVLCLDADEFIDDRHVPGELQGRLAAYGAQSNGPNCIKIPMVNYIATSHDVADERIVPLRMRRRREPSDSYKIILRGDLPADRLVIQHGSHWAKLGDQLLREKIDTDIWLAHYSERSPYQYIAKFVRGWCKVLASGQEELNRKTAYHYKTPFEYMRDDPASILHNKHFMGFKDEHGPLTDDPMIYKGGPLKYTGKVDEPIRAVRNLMGLLNDLAVRHGQLVDEFPFVRALVQDWEQQTHKLI